jgi:transcriptional regulatory protein LevR
MKLDTRLQILKDSGQISEKNYQGILNVISMMGKKWGIELTEENGAMFITHLAVAAGRIERGKAVEEVDQGVYDEVLSNRNFTMCGQAANDVESEMGIKIPDNEKKLLMIYLCMLLENNK